MSAYGVISPEKNYTNILNSGSVVCFLGHICEAMSRPQFFPFQLKLDVKECHFRLAIVVSSNPINFINAHSLHLTSTRNNAH